MVVMTMMMIDGSGTGFMRPPDVRRALASESEWLLRLSALKVSRRLRLCEPPVPHGKVGAVTPVSPDWRGDQITQPAETWPVWSLVLSSPLPVCPAHSLLLTCDSECGAGAGCVSQPDPDPDPDHDPAGLRGGRMAQARHRGLLAAGWGRCTTLAEVLAQPHHSLFR